MADDTHKPQRRMPRWAKITLGLSLALNLAVVGVVAGAALRGGGGGPKGGPGLGGSYAAAYMRALPREDRRAIFETVRKGADGAVMSRQARRASFEKMLTALRADPVDRAAIEAILTEQRSAFSQIQTATQAQWLDMVVAMTPQARADYADAVSEMLERKRGRPKKR